MRVAGAEFNLRELAGSMGDFGTLLPLAIGYITVCGMNPTGLLVMMGLANIATGLVYRLPMPIEPMKVLAIMAIAQAWSPEKVYTSGIVMGVIWLGMGITGVMSHIARWTPKTVATGIQISLGFLLAFEGIKFISGWWLLGLISLIIIIILRDNRYFPAAIVLVILGIVIMAIKGDLLNTDYQGITLPALVNVRREFIWPVLRDGGLAQIPLTATNAVIATSALISQYWPNRRVSERQLSINMGLMNLTLPFFGGMPLCHGAGGLAGQYFFGARTAGANILEGLIEISLGLFLGASIAALFAAFPMAIVGAMMLMVGFELMKFAKGLRMDKQLATVIVTVTGSLLWNMAAGFLVGMVVHYILLHEEKPK
ncbi:MAG: hypothetical protein H8D56_00835 [Planctomycetes bacterium]|nr:hypothetical protein [Planctomycetota bacterium]